MKIPFLLPLQLGGWPGAGSQPTVWSGITWGTQGACTPASCPFPSPPGTHTCRLVRAAMVRTSSLAGVTCRTRGEGQLRPPGPTVLEGDLQTPAEAHGVLEVPEAGQREGAPLLASAGSGQSGPQGPGTAPRVGAPRVPSATVHPWSCELRLGFRSGGSALQRQPGCSVLVTFFFLMYKSIY